MVLKFSIKQIEEIMKIYKLWIKFYYDDYKTEINNIFK